MKRTDASSGCHHIESHLGLLHILLINTGGAHTIGALPLLKFQVLVFSEVVLGPVNVFFEDRVRF